MKKYRISILYLIVSMLLGVYIVNGERILKWSLYSRDSERVARYAMKLDTRSQPSTTTSSLPATATSLPGLSCPAPLLPDLSPSLKRPTCFNGCCLPCPYVNNFYPANRIDTIYTALSVLRVISFFCVLIVLLSYLVLPNKREHQAITVLFFNTSLLMFLAVTFFYIGDHRKVQCADEYTQANMNNNSLCEVQGIILIFTTFSLVLYCFLLIVQLHLQTVWRCNIIQQYYMISQCLVLVISVVFTILPTVTQQISFEFGAVCLVSMKSINQYFWFPLAFIVIPGFAIHIWTFMYIAKSQCLMNSDFGLEDSLCESSTSTITRSITNVTGKDVVNSIKVQWRALMLSMAFLITFIIYWIYIHVSRVELSPLLDPSEDQNWLSGWVACILTTKTTNAQDYCYSTISKDHIPNMIFMSVAESLTAILGISIFVVFGTSINLWNEWRAWFRDRYGSVESQ